MLPTLICLEWVGPGWQGAGERVGSGRLRPVCEKGLHTVFTVVSIVHDRLYIHYNIVLYYVKCKTISPTGRLAVDRWGGAGSRPLCTVTAVKLMPNCCTTGDHEVWRTGIFYRRRFAPIGHLAKRDKHLCKLLPKCQNPNAECSGSPAEAGYLMEETRSGIYVYLRINRTYASPSRAATSEGVS